MKKTLPLAITLALGLSPVFVAATDMDNIQQQIQQLKSDYENRIQALEQQLTQMQQDKAAVVAPAAPVAAAPAKSRASNFNPKISVILDGSYYHDNKKGGVPEMLEELDGIHNAHNHGHEEEGHEDEDEHAHAHGGLDQGFNLHSVEMVLSASVDPYFDAFTQLVFTEDSVEVEEAYFLSRGLPAGLQVKGGKFFSDIGYVNKQHPHQWDFSNQNLAYNSLLGGHGLGDLGLQLSWLPEWPVYTRLGIEAFQGRNEKMNSLVDEHHYDFEDEEYELPLEEKKSGPRMWTAFAKFSPELGHNHALQGGLFYVYSNQIQEFHGDDEDDAGDQSHALEGNSWLLGTDWVYKYDNPAAYGKGDFRLQAEYLYQVKDLDVVYHGSKAAAVGQDRRFTQDGLYLQASYGFAPRWEVGLRYDATGLINKKEGNGQLLDEWDSSDRWTAGLSFRPTEFSLLRAQFTRGNYSIGGETETANQFWLQYQLSFGEHGAHSF